MTVCVRIRIWPVSADGWEWELHRGAERIDGGRGRGRQECRNAAVLAAARRGLAAELDPGDFRGNPE